MKSTDGLLIFVFAVTLCWLPVAGCYGQTAGPQSEVPGEDLVVYGAVLDSLQKLGKNSHFLVAESTSTFACGEPTCNGFSMGGCNGLRSNDEMPSERLAIVKRDLPGVQQGTTLSFEKDNQQCSSIRGAIPTSADFRYLNDPDVPRDWKDKYLVYFSQVGFDPSRTQALVNISLISWTDSMKSGGMYIVLNKVGAKWIPGGSSAVWRLTQ